MGLQGLNLADVRFISDSSEFLNTPLTGGECASNSLCCQKLLLIFRNICSP